MRISDVQLSVASNDWRGEVSFANLLVLAIGMLMDPHQEQRLPLRLSCGKSNDLPKILRRFTEICFGIKSPFFLIVSYKLLC